MKNKMEIESKNREIEYLKNERRRFECDFCGNSLKKFSGNLEKTVNKAFEVYEIEIQRMNEKIGTFENKIFSLGNTVRVIQNLDTFKGNKILGLKKQFYDNFDGKIRDKETAVGKMAEVIQKSKAEKAKIEKNYLEFEKKIIGKEFSNECFQNIIDDLNHQLEIAVCVKNKLEIENKHFSREVSNHKEKIAEKDYELSKKNSELAEKTEELMKKATELNEKIALIETLNLNLQQLKNSEKTIQALSNQKQKVSEANEKLQKSCKNIEKNIIEKSESIEQLKKNLADCSKIIFEKEQKIYELKTLVSQKTSEINEKNEIIHKFKLMEQEFNENVLELDGIVAGKQENLLKIKKKAKKFEEIIKNLEKDLQEKEKTCKELKESWFDLEFQRKTLQITKNSEIQELEHIICEKNQKICELANKLKNSKTFDSQENKPKILESENTLIKANKELKETIENAKTKEILLKKEIIQLNQKIEDFEGSNLQEKKNTLMQKFEKNSKKNKVDQMSQENRLKDLENENKIFVDTIDGLYLEIENAKEDFEFEIENYKKVVQTLKSENIANNQNKEKMFQELAELKFKVIETQKYAEQLEKEKNYYVLALNEAQAEENLKKKLKKENSEILIRKRELEHKINELEEELFEVNKENENFKIKIESQENLLSCDNLSIVQRLEKNIENLNETIKSLYFENEKLKRTFAEAHKNQENRFNELLIDTERLKNELNTLESDLKVKEAIISELQSSKLALEETYNDLIQTSKDYKQNQALLSEKSLYQKAKYKGKLKKMYEQIEEMNAKAASQSNENKENQKNLKKAKTEIKNLNKSCDELFIKNENLAAEVFKYCQEIDKLKGFLTESKAENEKMKDLIYDLEKEINESNIAISSLEEKYQESLKNCENIEKEVITNKKCEKDDFEQLTKENQKLQKSLSVYVLQIKDLETQLLNSQTSALALTTELNIQKESLKTGENIQKALLETEEKLITTEATILKLKEDKTDLNKFLNTLQINMKAEKKLAEEQFLEKEKIILFQSNSLIQANNDIQALKKELKDKNNLMNTKNKEFEQIKTEFQTFKLEKNSLESCLTNKIAELTQKIKTLEDRQTEILNKNLKISEEIIALDECNKNLSIENENLNNELLSIIKNEDVMSNLSESSCFGEEIEDFSIENKKLVRNLKRVKSAKIREKFDFSGEIAEKDKKIENLEEKVEVLQKKLDESSLTIEKLSKISSNTYEGREQLRKLLNKISNFK